MIKDKKSKFQFGIDFQELILKYTLTEEKGYKALQLYEDSYFTLISHTIIANAIKKYYRKKKRIPEEPYLKENIRVLYASNSRLFEGLSEEDRAEVEVIVNRLYIGKIADPETVLDKCINFARYISFKESLETVDVNDYNSYEHAIKKFQQVNNIGLELQEDFGVPVVAGMQDRAHRRDQMNDVHPSPFIQMNSLCNGDGLTHGNVHVVISKEKFFKTGFLINLAKGYMKMRKKLIYIDLENGEKALTTRTEQSILDETQEHILSGDYDTKLLKLLRKYRRLGAELYIKRFPSLTTNCDHIQKYIDKLWLERGFRADGIIIDYMVLAGSESGKKEDFGRISDAFLDFKNLIEKNDYQFGWTAAHVVREAADKRLKNKFESTDIAKCIDIPRHVDGIWSLQQNEEEEKAGVLRMEIVEQRNGKGEGKVLFWMNIETQRLKEFTKVQIKEYYTQMGGSDPVEEKATKRVKKVSKDL